MAWRGTRIWLVAVVVGTTLVAAEGPPAARAADEPVYAFHGERVGIGNSRYQLQVDVAPRDGRPPLLSVQVLETHDPRGPAFGTRAITYSHAGHFGSTPDLKTAHLDPTAPQMGTHGVIDMTWVPTSRLHEHCDGRFFDRDGYFQGTFRFKAELGSKELRVERVRVPGVLERGVDCNPPGSKCETYDLIQGTNEPGHTYVEAKDGANRPPELYAQRDWITTPSGWRTILTASAYVPADHFSLDGAGEHGSVEGYEGTYFRSRTTSEYTASAPANESGPRECHTYGATFEVTRTTSHGDLTPAGTHNFGSLEIVWINLRTSRWTSNDATAVRVRSEEA